MTIRILIADDHGVMRAALHALLESKPGIAVVGEAANGEETLALAEKVVPDLVLLDIEMPGIGGMETLRRLNQLSPQIHVLILSVYEDESMLREALKVGAAGYVIKRAVEEDLLVAIDAVLRGDLYIHPALTRLLVRDLSPTLQTKKTALETLTPREREVMGFVIQGYTNRGIAEKLEISVRTVEGHRNSLYNKLDIENRVELVELAEKYGWK